MTDNIKQLKEFIAKRNPNKQLNEAINLDELKRLYSQLLTLQIKINRIAKPYERGPADEIDDHFYAIGDIILELMGE